MEGKRAKLYNAIKNADEHVLKSLYFNYLQQNIAIGRSERAEIHAVLETKMLARSFTAFSSLGSKRSQDWKLGEIL